MHFVYIKIPAAADSTMRDRKIADVLELALTEEGIGSVMGWGSSMGEVQADGTRPLMFLRIDIEVSDLLAARTLFHLQLPAADAPVGTEVHYTLDGARLQDVWHSTGWVYDEPIGAYP